MAHPLSFALALPAQIAHCIQSCAKLGVASVAKERLEFFMFWKRRAKELQKEEMSIRSAMDPVVERAVGGKRLALFKDMLHQYKYPDAGVLDELIDGASLVEDVATTGMLPFKFTPALLTSDSLQTSRNSEGHR